MEAPVKEKNIAERIKELLELIADPKTPEYKVEYLEKRVQILQKLSSQ